MHHRALAAIQERTSEVIEGVLADFLFTAVAFESRLIVVRAPGTDVVALTPGTLQRALFPPERMDVGLTLVDIEELVNVREHWHG